MVGLNPREGIESGYLLLQTEKMARAPLHCGSSQEPLNAAPKTNQA
jgi:hypothetical protein